MNQEPAPKHPTARLLAIVEVDHDQRVRCGNPGCGHSVYKAIHVVQEGPELLVLGSTCFNKRYGVGALGAPQYGGGGGRKLNAEERELMLNNTMALLQRFEEEHAAHREKLLRMRAELSKRAAETERPIPVIPPAFLSNRWTVARTPASNNPPWTWMRPRTSMAGFKLRDGTGWVRVQHRDGMQMLAPWPVFDGWDEWLPSQLGQPRPELLAYQICELQPLIAFLRERAVAERISGLWSEIASVCPAH